jgi:hypothetical protein
MSGCAHADTYHRFWRGTKKSDLSWSQFEDGLNQIFIAATVKTGSGKGMIAYEPTLIEGKNQLPDEIALVSYANKGAYDSLYSTSEGKAYQSLHWDYFDRPNSHSLVPQAFTGSVTSEQAYDLKPTYADWMKNSTTVLVFFKQSMETDQTFMTRAQSHLSEAIQNDSNINVFDRVVLVSQNYWIEYVSAANSIEAGSSNADMTFPVSSGAEATVQITPLHGINLQF